VRQELEAYGEGLEDKTEILVLNKIDAVDEATRTERASELEAVSGRRPLMISGVSGEGVTALMRAALGEVRAARAEAAAETEAEPEAWRP
jgi:GTP-binding protein